MKKNEFDPDKEFDADLEEVSREPVYRKRPKGLANDDEDFEPRSRKKSGKRSHRKPAPGDDFGGK